MVPAGSRTRSCKGAVRARDASCKGTEPRGGGYVVPACRRPRVRACATVPLGSRANSGGGRALQAAEGYRAGACIALLSHQSTQLCGLGVILSHTLAVLIHGPKGKLSVTSVPTGCPLQHFLQPLGVGLIRNAERCAIRARGRLPSPKLVTASDFKGPTSARSAWAPRRTYRATCVGWHGAEGSVRDGQK